jgi:hypothetical protein
MPAVDGVWSVGGDDSPDEKIDKTFIDNEGYLPVYKEEERTGSITSRGSSKRQQQTPQKSGSITQLDSLAESMKMNAEITKKFLAASVAEKKARKARELADDEQYFGFMDAPRYLSHTIVHKGSTVFEGFIFLTIIANIVTLALYRPTEDEDSVWNAKLQVSLSLIIA